jgi:hypothetical protein
MQKNQGDSNALLPKVALPLKQRLKNYGSLTKNPYQNKL